MKYGGIFSCLKTIGIGFMLGWCGVDAIRLFQGDMRPLTRKGVQFMYITQTQQHEADTLGTLEKRTTLQGFRITLLR